jgi:hypothetical protein
MGVRICDLVVVSFYLYVCVLVGLHLYLLVVYLVRSMCLCMYACGCIRHCVCV